MYRLNIVKMVSAACLLGPVLSASPYGAPKHEYPKHNCSIEQVIEPATVCTPAFKTVCEEVDVVVKKVVDKEQCYPVTKTVCTESVEVVPNEVCTFTYGQTAEEANAVTVTVSFSQPCLTQMITVCEPNHYGGYGEQGVNCKEVPQQTCYNEPQLAKEEVPFTLTYPTPEDVCQDKSIDLVRVACEDIVEDKCIIVPEVEEGVEKHEVCHVELDEPSCEDIELDLPKEGCIEIVYGYAHESHAAEPGYTQ